MTLTLHTRQNKDCEGWFSPPPYRSGDWTRVISLAEVNLPTRSLPTPSCAQAAIHQSAEDNTRERIYALRPHKLLLKAIPIPGLFHKVPADIGLVLEATGFLWQVQNFWPHFKPLTYLELILYRVRGLSFCFPVLYMDV